MVFKMNVINTYILTLESPGIRRFRGQMTARCSLQTYIIRVCILIDPYRGVRKTQTSEPGKLRPPGCLENTDPRKTSRKPQFLYLDYHVTYSFFHAYVTCLKNERQYGVKRVSTCGSLVDFFLNDCERNSVSLQSPSIKPRQHGKSKESGRVYRANDKISLLVRCML